MPSTYTTNGGIEKIATGEQSGSWGTTTNTNFDIIDRITNGVGTITLSGTSSNLQTSDGALSDGQYKALILTGSPSGTHTITVLPNDAQKIYFVNNTTSQSVIFNQGSGSNVTIPANTSDIIYCDGGGASGAVVSLIDDVDLTGYMQSANNLSDVSSAATALINLGVNASADELNILDGVTASTADLNILDGATVTTAEINYNDITTLGTSEASKVVTADANGDVNLSEELKAKSYNETFLAITSSSGTATLDCEAGNVFSLTLSENVTTFTWSNPPASGTAYGFTLKVVQDASASGYTVTWPTSVDWPDATAPTLTDTTSAVDQFVFYTHDGGTTWYGFVAGQALG